MPISSDFVLTSRYPDVFVPDISFPGFALEEFEAHGRKTAYIYTPTNEMYSYLDICYLIKTLATGLHQKYNLKKGDIVATCMTNCPEFLITFLAVQRLGAIITTANPASTVQELEHQYSSVSPKFIVTEEELLPKILKVAPKLMELQKVIILHEPHESFYPNVDTLEALMHAGEMAEEPEWPEIDPKNDTACILYSSGTTGLPKGVMLTHKNLVAEFCQTTPCYQPAMSRRYMAMPHKGDVVYTPFPYFHISGIYCGLIWPLLNGATSICMPKYRPEEFLFNVQKYRVSVMMLPPPIMVFLAKSPLVAKYDLTSVHLILSAAAPLSKETALQDLKQLNDVPYVVQGLGITEMTGLCTICPLNEKAKEKVASCGTLLPGTSCKVISTKTGKNCMPKQLGELWLKGPQMMKGYLNNPKATADTITQDGWLKTGDIGYFDDDEYIYISDRLKELIKVKGFQVAPAELEALLLTHPSVAEAIVIGVPDNYSGELPRAYVALKDGHHDVTEHDIQNYVKDHVSSYKRLAGGVIFVKKVPKSPVGKLLRQTLRKKVKVEFENKSKL